MEHGIWNRHCSHPFVTFLSKSPSILFSNFFRYFSLSIYIFRFFSLQQIKCSAQGKIVLAQPITSFQLFIRFLMARNDKYFTRFAIKVIFHHFNCLCVFSKRSSANYRVLWTFWLLGECCSSEMGNNQNTIMELLFNFAISSHFPAHVTNQLKTLQKKPKASDLVNVIICSIASGEISCMIVLKMIRNICSFIVIYMCYNNVKCARFQENSSPWSHHNVSMNRM